MERLLLGAGSPMEPWADTWNSLPTGQDPRVILLLSLTGGTDTDSLPGPSFEPRTLLGGE